MKIKFTLPVVIGLAGLGFAIWQYQRGRLGLSPATIEKIQQEHGGRVSMAAARQHRRPLSWGWGGRGSTV